MAKFWTMACLSAALLTGALSFAGDDGDSNKPKGECENGVSTEAFAASEKFRIDLWTKIKAHRDEMESGKEKMWQILEASLEGRAMHRPQVNVSDRLRGMFGLNDNQLKTVPLVSDKTVQALNQLYDGNNYKNLPEGVYRQDVYRDLRTKAGQAVEEDPYFQWMKTHSVDNREKRNQYTGFFTFDQDGIAAEKQKPDPVSYFWQLQDISGPSRLNWKMALVRVYRDLDPELNEAQIKLCQGILHIHAATTLIHLEFREQFETRNNGWASKEAWDYATDLKAARQAERKILDEQLKKYGSQYKREGYELARRWFNEQGEPVNLLRRILNNRENPGDKEAFVELKKKLTLAENTDAERVWRILTYSGNDKVSYEQALMRLFGGDDGKLADRTLSGLAKIIEVAEAMQSNEAWVQFLIRHKVAAGYLEY